jgi:hypothetical protein
MSTDLQTFALKNALAEIKNTCPDVSNTFIFKDNGDLLASDEDTDEETATRAAETLQSFSKKTGPIGGFESALFYNPTNQMNIFRINDYYLTIISSESPDRRDSANIARILIPTVLRLADKIRSSTPEYIKIGKPEVAEEKPPHAKKADGELTSEETKAVETEPLDEPLEPEFDPDSFFPDPPVNQFMVENVGGLLAAPDTVRIDNAVAQQWKDLYGEKAINEVDVETLNGQTIRCKFKPIKDSKHDGKGIIQLPQKIQQLLQTSKGELVMVKPAIKQ